LISIYNSSTHQRTEACDVCRSQGGNLNALLPNFFLDVPPAETGL